MYRVYKKGKIGEKIEYEIRILLKVQQLRICPQLVPTAKHIGASICNIH